MHVEKCIRKIVHILLCIVLSINCFSITAFARTPIDIEKTSTLTLQYPCKDVEFQVFKVADVSIYGEYTFTDNFKNYSVSLETLTQEGWRTLAYTLSGYIARDSLKPQQYASTDTQGQLVFSDLKAGLYLVTGDACIRENKRYTPSPFLVALPSLDKSQKWLNEVTATPKYSRDTLGKPGAKPHKNTIDRRVIKLWKNDDVLQRPDYIDVQLLRNGQIWDTVRLNADNSWRYEWNNLDAQYTWQLVEKEVPEDYLVTVDLDGSLYVVTNYINIPKISSPNVPLLPQTGVLWWPVGIFIILGTILLILGFFRRKYKHD